MKIFLSRIENWLFIGPILQCTFTYLFVGDSSLDFHVRDTYFVVGKGYLIVLVFWWLIFVIPFLLHVILRKKNGTTRPMCIIHVLLSLIVVAITSIPFSAIAPMPRRYYDYSTWDIWSKFSNEYFYSTIFIPLFLLLQLVFVIYAIVMLMKKKVFKS